MLHALRQGRTGADLIAALALGGTLAVGEYLAGALIALMLATGASATDRKGDSAAAHRAIGIRDKRVPPSRRSLNGLPPPPGRDNGS
ncbi:hypothetical protein GCM10023084_36720 [Streptomyces lacrimifluminis]|uniref:Uncharacterized protein n=1 Tax=Streptomyces lacrimifluminis TaxID=1500077 RepID=A0A917NYE5_9ACTN|nr:hypothetical protein GCM10012282_37230 [Streptomyces lacrimifluminis]